MTITDEEIKKFEVAITGTAPEWDPDWKVTKTLIELVPAQADEIQRLERRIDNLRRAQERSIEVINNALSKTLSAKMTLTPVSDEQAQKAAAELEQAIQAKISGAKVISYAGTVLRFVAKIIL